MSKFLDPTGTGVLIGTSSTNGGRGAAVILVGATTEDTIPVANLLSLNGSALLISQRLGGAAVVVWLGAEIGGVSVLAAVVLVLVVVTPVKAEMVFTGVDLNFAFSNFIKGFFGVLDLDLDGVVTGGVSYSSVIESMSSNRLSCVSMWLMED